MIALARSESAVAVVPDVFDRDPWALNVANGTLDLKTGELRPHRREDLLTKLSPVAFDQAARSELWETFLHRATCGDGELQRFLQKIAGLCLTGITDEEVMLFLYGPTPSAKTTFVEALKGILGDYAATTKFDTFADTKQAQPNAASPDVARLAGARLVAAAETSRALKLNAELIKWLTGGGTLAARALYKDTVEFRPAFKLLLASNARPKLPDADDAVWRRVREVRFPHTIPERERKPDFKRRLRDPEDGGPAVLAWAVEGCLLWQRESLGAPPAVRAATRQYRQAMNPLRDWIAEWCRLAPDARGKLEEFWESYRQWAAVNGVRVILTMSDFRERLKALGCSGSRTKTERYWTGIGLLTERREEPDPPPGDATLGR
jgi:putative DNA primase/helicase